MKTAVSRQNGAPLGATDAHLEEPGQGVLGRLQDTDAVAVVGLQNLLLGEFLIDPLFGGGAVHSGRVQLHGQHFVMLLLLQRFFLEAFDFSVHHVYLVMGHAVAHRRSSKE